MKNLEVPHRRYNPLTNEWILISPQRTSRPWQGQVEKGVEQVRPKYDPNCYLCPGNNRAENKKNPEYASTYVFDNDFPALLMPDDFKGDHAPLNIHITKNQKTNEELLLTKPVNGFCRVVCFSPRHDLSLALLDETESIAVLNTWSEQMRELGSQPFIDYVQIFENNGAMMGASSPHPHSQIWATSFIPNEPAKEIASLSAYHQRIGSCLLCDYLNIERSGRERIVLENQDFTAVVPFWAIWPYEILILSQRHFASLTDAEPTELASLADLLRRVTIRYDNLFETSFPYSMGLHQAPTDGKPNAECHFHIHFYPPLLRSATVRKFMVGFEMLAMPQRDLTPETAAERLRVLPEAHYKSRQKTNTD
jgi:UDPglucose--hexose-1-phosphate uridylyltransferase